MIEQAWLFLASYEAAVDRSIDVAVQLPGASAAPPLAESLLVTLIVSADRVDQELVYSMVPVEQHKRSRRFPSPRWRGCYDGR